MEKKSFSTNMAVISVYNNRDLVKKMKDSVISCVEDTGIRCEVIALDNTENRFASAAEAYNYVIEQGCDAEVFVFCHQDIIFLNHAVLDLYRCCTEQPMALFGAAGVENKGHNSIIISSMAMMREGWNYKTLEKDSLHEVFTLDECLIAANRRVFDKVKFDASLCDRWHLYAVELCLQCHLQHIPVYVYSSNIVHLSGGRIDTSFYECEKRLAKKYRRYFNVISYTCGWIYTNPMKYWMLRIYRKIRFSI